jgi:hypothetical protein
MNLGFCFVCAGECSSAAHGEHCLIAFSEAEYIEEQWSYSSFTRGFAVSEIHNNIFVCPPSWIAI